VFLIGNIGKRATTGKQGVVGVPARTRHGGSRWTRSSTAAAGPHPPGRALPALAPQRVAECEAAAPWPSKANRAREWAGGSFAAGAAVAAQAALRPVTSGQRAGRRRYLSSGSGRGVRRKEKHANSVRTLLSHEFLCLVKFKSQAVHLRSHLGACSGPGGAGCPNDRGLGPPQSASVSLSEAQAHWQAPSSAQPATPGPHLGRVFPGPADRPGGVGLRSCLLTGPGHTAHGYPSKNMRCAAQPRVHPGDPPGCAAIILE
jgi:hypothetical protein